MSDLDALAANYRVAFFRFLPRREEAALAAGYELGRSSVAAGVSVLELARIHHDVLLDVLEDSPSEDLGAVARAASDFFLEVLAAYDLAQRTFLAKD